MFTEPNDHHRWLQRLIGLWEFENTCDAEADGEATHSRGTERVSAFGDLWVVGDGEGDMPGAGPMRMRITLGFDPLRDRFVGTWIGSPMGSMFVYEGTRDGDVLTLDTSGPSFEDPGKTVPYQDIIELHGNDRRVLRSRCLDEDGSWMDFMRGEYTRVG